jgi:hypothetical protein
MFKIVPLLLFFLLAGCEKILSPAAALNIDSATIDRTPVTSMADKLEYEKIKILCEKNPELLVQKSQTAKLDYTTKIMTIEIGFIDCGARKRNLRPVIEFVHAANGPAKSLSFTPVRFEIVPMDQKGPEFIMLKDVRSPAIPAENFSVTFYEQKIDPVGIDINGKVLPYVAGYVEK